jgi:hypothetical protein
LIDAIRLYIPRKAAQDLASRLKDFRRRDINTGQGKLDNMTISQNLDGVMIKGSIAKFLNGENCTPLTRQGVREAIEKLETETGLDLSAAVIGSAECGSTFILKENPAEYLRLFGFPPTYKKTDHYSTVGQLETVSFGTPTGSFQFCGYDKTREMKDKRRPLPPMFSGCNCLRLEHRIIKRRGIRAKFNRDLTAYDLFDYETYRQLQALFLEAYQAIPKTGRRVYIDTSRPVTPAELEKRQAEQYRQGDHAGYLVTLQKLREAGTLTEKNLERIRARDRQQGRDYSLSDTSPLIAELDSHVLNTALYGA